MTAYRSRVTIFVTELQFNSSDTFDDDFQSFIINLQPSAVSSRASYTAGTVPNPVRMQFGAGCIIDRRQHFQYFLGITRAPERYLIVSVV